jgi:hypothetical protein
MEKLTKITMASVENERNANLLMLMLQSSTNKRTPFCKPGFISDQWAETVIFPLFKTGNRTGCSIYRGTSLLNSFYKIDATIV